MPGGISRLYKNTRGAKIAEKIAELEKQICDQEEHFEWKEKQN